MNHAPPTTPRLFLDVDGVLTTTWSPDEMVPACVERLEHILCETGAALVISSSWRARGVGPSSALQIALRRVCREMDGHTERFERIISRLEGQTPSLPDRTRQDEIQQYVQRFRPARFAAVDDSAPDFAIPAPEWLVLTDPTQGLDEIAASRLCRLLSG